jgi:hypothetical protein
MPATSSRPATGWTEHRPPDGPRKSGPRYRTDNGRSALLRAGIGTRRAWISCRWGESRGSHHLVVLVIEHMAVPHAPALSAKVLADGDLGP